ncbi:MAG: tandem-95 repeat protein [Thiomargarita sp.]|nr:tandem-95 repeat protein [Thiomargarita sp.]
MLQHNKLNSDLPFQAKAVLPIVIITEAKFFRIGNDLEVKTFEDSWIIQDYFIKPVPIKTIDGLMSVDDVISKLCYHSEPILLASEKTTGLISSGLEQIGTITVAVENVSVESQEGTIRSLKVGEPVYLHETILTKAHSYVKIILNDGTVFQLGPHSRARLDKYNYEPGESDGGEFESYVYSGTFRYISGKISGHDQGQHTTIKTPSIQINIRGSDIDAQINADGSTTILHLSGLISITSQYLIMREILVYERGTLVHIPNQAISYRIKTLTEDEIQVKIGENWNEINNLEPLQNDILDIEHKDISTDSPDVGAYNPFSSGNIDVNDDKLIDELRSIDETSPVEAIEDVFVHLEMDETVKTPEVTISSSLNILPSLSHLEVTLDEDNSKEILVEEGNLTEFSQPAHGEVVDNGDGTLSYIPNLNFNGEDSFTYTLDEIDSVVVKLTINAVNDHPVAVDNSINTDENVSIVFPPETLLENDFDVDEENSISIVSVEENDLTHGTVSLNESGDFVYQPEPDFYGSAELVYTIEDSHGEQSTAIVNIEVNPVNDPPVVVDKPTPSFPSTPPDVPTVASNHAPIAKEDSINTNEDIPLVFHPEILLENDFDVDGDSLSIVSVEGNDLTHGTVSLNESGEVMYQPESDFNGLAEFVYTIEDSQGKQSTASVKVDVKPINDSPIAKEDNFNTNEDIPLVFHPEILLENDFDVDGDSLSIVSVEGNDLTHGTVSLNESGEVMYQPESDFNGLAEFVYTIEDSQGEQSTASVKVDVKPVNDPPIAKEDNFSTNEDIPLTQLSEKLLENDFDVDGDSLSIVSVEGNDLTHGTVSLNESGEVMYQPESDFNGLAEFVYTIEDSQGEQSTASVKVNVNPVNDPPIAVDDTFVLETETSLIISADSLSKNDRDIDNDALQVIEVLKPSNGNVSLSNGEIGFSFKDNTVTTGGFEYILSDGEKTDIGQVNITRGNINLPPVANSDSGLSTFKNTPITLSSLLENDSDPNLSDTYTISQVIKSNHGDVELTADGNVIFTPELDFTGNASFEYLIKDNHGAESVPAQVEIEIKDVLIAVDDFTIYPKNTTGSTSSTFLLENDNKEEEPLTITNVDNAINGEALLLENGDIQFTPTKDFEGDAQFDYTVTDALGKTDKATVTVQVINTPPVAEDDGPFTTKQNTELSISKADLLSNDWDINSDALTLTIEEKLHENGSIKLVDENIVFTPTTDFSGEASFEYTIKDTSGATDTAKVNITVTPPLPPIPPIINFDNTPLEYNTAIGEARQIYSDAKIDDLDSPNFEDGTVKVLIENNRTPNDILEIQNIGSITVSNSGEIKYNETPIGNFFTNFVTGSLLVGLNENANPETTAALLQAITYRNTSTNPSTKTRAEPLTEIRTVEITLNDGDGGESLPISRDIKITYSPPPLEAVDDGIENEISLPFNSLTHLSVDDLLSNDKPTNPYDILTVSSLSNKSEGVNAILVNHEVQLFIDGFINDDPSKPITFDYTVKDDHGGEDTATVTVNPSNVISGTSGEDTLEGTDSLDIIVGKEGNDTFAPSVGSDILLGGEGEDVFLFNPNTAAGVRIDGGKGIDTLRFDGAEGKALDLIQNNAQPSEQQLDLQSIEVIDLQGNNNQLRLSVDDVLELSDSNHLTIEGNASNFVNSVAEGWSKSESDSTDSYIYYKNDFHDAALLVSADITYQFIS